MQHIVKHTQQLYIQGYNTKLHTVFGPRYWIDDFFYLTKIGDNITITAREDISERVGSVCDLINHRARRMFGSAASSVANIYFDTIDGKRKWYDELRISSAEWQLFDSFLAKIK